MVLGPLMHLETLFLEGPQGLVPSTSGIISPALPVHTLSPPDGFKLSDHVTSVALFGDVVNMVKLGLLAAMSRCYL